jgi:hypothetical protein
LVIHESFGTAGGRIMTLPPPGGKFESNAASTGALMRYPNLGTTLALLKIRLQYEVGPKVRILFPPAASLVRT